MSVIFYGKAFYRDEEWSQNKIIQIILRVTGGDTSPEEIKSDLLAHRLHVKALWYIDPPLNQKELVQWAQNCAFEDDHFVVVACLARELRMLDLKQCLLEKEESARLYNNWLKIFLHVSLPDLVIIPRNKRAGHSDVPSRLVSPGIHSFLNPMAAAPPEPNDELMPKDARRLGSAGI